MVGWDSKLDCDSEVDWDVVLELLMGQPNINKFHKNGKSNETSQISNLSSAEENFLVVLSSFYTSYLV